ncbi:hypothetical protein ACC786_14110 [Rhizobium ruizarguesonis]|uniref:P-II family nitrogen regulator n=1 Tax=Rhizobium ruizarguesonis TaxID=2081791 RepID=UPI0010300BD8|nr:P-II family nitrogen regulator [Rhizobium ruizarguesonis]TAT96105.1 hypothetical protein ELI55_26640 [Rhizobium ruizarguesonis]
MLKIEFITRAFKIDDIRAALAHVDLVEFLAFETIHTRPETGVTDVIRGINCEHVFIPCVRVEVFVEPQLRDKAIDAIRRAAIHERMIADTISLSTIVEFVEIQTTPARGTGRGTAARPVGISRR